MTHFAFGSFMFFCTLFNFFFQFLTFLTDCCQFHISHMFTSPKTGTGAKIAPSSQSIRHQQQSGLSLSSRKSINLFFLKRSARAPLSGCSPLGYDIYWWLSDCLLTRTCYVFIIHAFGTAERPRDDRGARDGQWRKGKKLLSRARRFNRRGRARADDLFALSLSHARLLSRGGEVLSLEALVLLEMKCDPFNHTSTSLVVLGGRSNGKWRRQVELDYSEWLHWMFNIYAIFF